MVSTFDIFCLQEQLVIGKLPVETPDGSGKKGTRIGKILSTEMLNDVVPISEAYRLLPKDMAPYVQMLCPRCRGVIYISTLDGEKELLVPNHLRIFY